MHQPYFYIIEHLHTGQLYAGVQYGKTAHPSNILNTYFTSSSRVKRIIEEATPAAFVVRRIREGSRSYVRALECRYLSIAYKRLGPEFTTRFLNRNLSPGIINDAASIAKANITRIPSARAAAMKRIAEGTHNWQIGPKYVPTEEHRRRSAARMKGNTLGALINRDDEYRRGQAERSKGNLNVRGKKWWYNPNTQARRRSVTSPGPEWLQGNPSSLTEEGRANIVSAASKPKTEEHKRKLSAAAKNRPNNNKGTIWVINKDGKRRRVQPGHIPDGFTQIKRRT